MDLVKISKVTAGKRTRVFRMLSDDADHYTMEAAILQKLLFCLYKQQNGLLTFVSTPHGPLGDKKGIFRPNLNRCQRNISLKLYIERQINVTSDFLSLLVFSNELVPSKNVKNTRSLRSLGVLLHFFGRYSLRLENTLKL